MLHEWIKLVEDSLFAMRAISAGLGTIAIVLVFVAVREVYRSLAQDPDSGIGELAGTFAALLYATNVEMVLSDRIVRMYPLMMCAELLQIACFVRAQRRDRLLDYIGVATFTAVMIATNFTSIFLILAEGLWLGWLLLSAGEYSRWLAVFRSACALAAGVAMLTPWLPRALASSWRAVKGGVIDWIALQPISWPYTTLRNSTDNSILFRVFVALAALGVRQQWRSARPVMEFLAVWTTGPILAVLAVTYLIHPLEFPRYVLIACVGIFAFAGFSAASVRSTALRIVLPVVIIYLSAGSVHYRLRRSDEAAGETRPCWL